MATTCTFKCFRRKAGRGHGLLLTEISGTISLADVTVAVAPQVSGGAATMTTATVTADVQNMIYVDSTAATTAGIDPGSYTKISSATYRKHRALDV
jgi:hypothetical protein